MIELVLQHLESLVAFDTRNPPRAIGTGGIFDYIKAQLPGFQFDLVDHGAGAVSLLATRGAPKLVFNVHLDTVPSSPDWTADPLRLRVTDDRAIGLGACDIKGAAACLLSAAAASQGDAALLFSSDEEANDARCIPAFLKSAHGFEHAIIAEPTAAQAVLAHRGIAAVRMQFCGRAGHASGANAATDSAVHNAIRWGNSALKLVDSYARQRFGGLTGLRFNIGRVEGGIKANMIAPSAEVRFGFRPLPSQSFEDVHTALQACVEGSSVESYAETFRGPPLPAGDTSNAEDRRLRARDFAESLGLRIGNAVDFWTEASLFSQAGINALVYGPGDIAQAHTADEWVALDQLSEVASNYQRILNHGFG